MKRNFGKDVDGEAGEQVSSSRASSVEDTSFFRPGICFYDFQLLDVRDSATESLRFHAFTGICTLWRQRARRHE